MSRRWFGALGVLAAAGLAGCASDWQERFEQSQRDYQDQAQVNEELRASASQAIAERESRDAQLEAMKSEQKRLLDERNLAAKRAAEWQAEAERNKAAPAPAASSGNESAAAAGMLRDLKANGYASARLAPDGNIEVPIPSDVTFGSGKAELTDAGRKSLKGLGSQLGSSLFAPYMVRIEGHTDADPIKRSGFKDNRDLGAERANEVVRFMEKEMGIAPGRLMSATMGQHKPVADNKTADGRAKNRRVEVIVVIPREAYLAQAK
jgi:chemotaxis protein MotB